jgi:hypothetical protein
MRVRAAAAAPPPPMTMMMMVVVVVVVMMMMMMMTMMMMMPSLARVHDRRGSANTLTNIRLKRRALQPMRLQLCISARILPQNAPKEQEKIDG